MSCSTKSTVTFSARMAPSTRSMRANFSSAETPLVGSSRSRILGFTASAMAMSSSLRIPSGSTEAGSSRYSARRKRSSVSSATASGLATPSWLPTKARRPMETMPSPTSRFS